MHCCQSLFSLTIDRNVYRSVRCLLCYKISVLSTRMSRSFTDFSIRAILSEKFARSGDGSVSRTSSHRNQNHTFACAARSCTRRNASTKAAGFVRHSASFSLPSHCSDVAKDDNGADCKRTVFSPHQRKQLEQLFSTRKYISRNERSRLACSLSLREHQVKIWFQNRRMKWRNEQESVMMRKALLAPAANGGGSTAEFIRRALREADRDSAKSLSIQNGVDKPM